LTNYMFTGLTTRRLSITDGGYDIIQQLLPLRQRCGHHFIQIGCRHLYNW